MVDFDDHSNFLSSGAQERSRETVRSTVKGGGKRPVVEDLLNSANEDDMMDKLLKKSKIFVIGQREFKFDNSE